MFESEKGSGFLAWGLGYVSPSRFPRYSFALACQVSGVSLFVELGWPCKPEGIFGAFDLSLRVDDCAQVLFPAQVCPLPGAPEFYLVVAI